MPKIYESPDNGKTVYEREFGSQERTLSTMMNKKNREIMIEYLLLKVRQADWHGVSDAANDIREMEAAETRECSK